MSSPDQDTQLPEQIRKALAADTSCPSAETDQRIMEFAAKHAPHPPSAHWKTWMPATAACCLAGVLIVSLLPEQAPELTHSMDAGPELDMGSHGDAMVAKEGLGEESIAADALAERYGAPEAHVAASEPVQAPIPAAMPKPLAAATPKPPHKPESTHSLAKIAATAAAPSQATLRLPARFYKPLLSLKEQHLAVNDAGTGLAKSRLGNPSIKRAKKPEQQSAQTDASLLSNAKVSPVNASNVDYETLRSDCNCGLPDTLQQAITMLAKGQILPDHSKTSAAENKE